jgi:hypothetical protein
MSYSLISLVCTSIAPYQRSVHCQLPHQGFQANAYVIAPMGGTLRRISKPKGFKLHLCHNQTSYKYKGGTKLIS